MLKRRIFGRLLLFEKFYVNLQKSFHPNKQLSQLEKVKNRIFYLCNLLIINSCFFVKKDFFKWAYN